MKEIRQSVERVNKVITELTEELEVLELKSIAAIRQEASLNYIVRELDSVGSHLTDDFVKQWCDSANQMAEINRDLYFLRKKIQINGMLVTQLEKLIGEK